MAAPVHPYSEYGIALRELRSARTWLGRTLVACVLLQILGFAVMYFTQQPYEFMNPKYKAERDEPARTWADVLRDKWKTPAEATAVTETASASQPATTRAAPQEWVRGTPLGQRLNVHKQWDATYATIVPLTQLVGLVVVMATPVIIFIILLLVLVAQAPGVTQITRALIWSVILLFMVFPWQFFIHSFPIPGVLYGYQEMLKLIGPHVVHNPSERVLLFEKLLIIGRFIIWPLVSLVVLLMVSERLRSGLMLAIGHPLQSMMRPRTAGVGAGLPASMPIGPKPPQNIGPFTPPGGAGGPGGTPPPAHS